MFCLERTTSVLETRVGAVMCIHKVAEVFKKLRFMGVCGARADSQLNQAISADSNTATVAKEEV